MNMKGKDSPVTLWPYVTDVFEPSFCERNAPLPQTYFP